MCLPGTLFMEIDLFPNVARCIHAMYQPVFCQENSFESNLKNVRLDKCDISSISIS